jgi:hypothetical protein
MQWVHTETFLAACHIQLQLQLVVGMFTVLLRGFTVAAPPFSHFRSARSSSQLSLLLRDGAADRPSAAVL